ADPGGTTPAPGDLEPAVAGQREDPAAQQQLSDLRKSRENLRRIGHAFQPMFFGGAVRGLSLRGAILPSLGKEEARMYEQFKFDEPWDSPHNLKLLESMPSVYAPVASARAKPGHTFYQIFTGPGALYPAPEAAVRVTDITDGLSNTLLVAEAAEAVP